tara:strand:- start:828 stop:968 length:141 start_codon:yes stop_codon:yes gene_type:complete
MDRYDLLTLLASALLSVYAYIAANDKPQVEYIIFDEPIIITSDLAQ